MGALWRQTALLSFLFVIYCPWGLTQSLAHYGHKLIIVECLHILDAILSSGNTVLDKEYSVRQGKSLDFMELTFHLGEEAGNKELNKAENIRK